MTARLFSKIAGAAGLVALAACTPPSKNLELLEGPPIQDVVTPIDQALHCLDSRISKQLAFSVGPIPDLTGRESYNDGGAGKYVSQGASDIVQSALFKSGVTVINRRSMGIPQTEARWGLRDIKGQMPVNLFISGSVNTLDFIPGGGVSLGVSGVGPQYRQNRILVGMDLAVTNAANGQVVANIPLQKQIFSDETGAFTHRFFGTTLVNMDAGVQRREALNMALRQMLYLATYELLTQLMPPAKYEECSALIDDEVGGITGTKTSGEQLNMLQEAREAQAQAAEAEAEAAAAEAAEAEAQAAAEAETTAAAEKAAAERAAEEALAAAPAETAQPAPATPAPAPTAEAKVAPQAEPVAPVEAETQASAAPAAQQSDPATVPVAAETAVADPLILPEAEPAPKEEARVTTQAPEAPQAEATEDRADIRTTTPEDRAIVHANAPIGGQDQTVTEEVEDTQEVLAPGLADADAPLSDA
ncbi:CsgG/HfaB family protein [Pseudooceanicola sp. 200-1SW]|uniref:CsgG/HfaB family protein n=1 Tax=Pseudooceanicola sp. 200-1SW TaxID=3425949 RepID=UPI003D7F1CFD